MSLIGVQSQSGTIQQLNRVLEKKPLAYLLLGNAVNFGIARTIRDLSPSTLILLRAQADNWSLDAGVVDFAYRSMTIADPYQAAGLCDFLLPPNEPIVWNDVDARRLNTQMVQCAELYKSSGYSTGAYNFSVGNPDYPLWPYLQDGIAASNGWLFLHQYGAPNMQRDAENLSLRHRKVWPLLRPDVQAMLKIGVTECFIDLGIGRAPDGEPTAGGYHALRNPTEDNLWWIRNLTQQLDWYDAELAKDQYVEFVTGFGYAMEEPWNGLGFDVAKEDPDREYFNNWMKVGGTPIPKPDPEPEPAPFAFEVYPLPSVAPISQAFGVNPDYYRQFNLPGHEGIDLAVPIGMPVLSVSAGTIASASSTGNYGRHVRVTHADGWQTLYAHLSAIAAQVGQSVDAGDVLGNSGSSGNTTGPHLHFGLKHLGFTYTSPNGTVWPFNIFDATDLLEAVAVTGGEIMRTPGQRVAAGVRSIGVDFLADSAFFEKARALGLKYPLGQEYRDRITGEPVIAGQAFGPDGVLLETIEWQWGMDQIKAFSLLTGEPWTKPIGDGGGTLPPAKRLTTTDVSQYGFRVEPYAPQPGESFFGLIAIGNIQSGPQVGTTSTMNAFNQVGGAAIGYKLTHAYDVANHKFEKHDSPTVGVVLGPGSYIPPSASDRFYVSADDGQQGGSWPTPKGDVLVAGMPNGNHWQATYTWQLMTG